MIHGQDLLSPCHKLWQALELGTGQRGFNIAHLVFDSDALAPDLSGLATRTTMIGYLPGSIVQ